jgi:hypothetical protein
MLRMDTNVMIGWIRMLLICYRLCLIVFMIWILMLRMDTNVMIGWIRMLKRMNTNVMMDYEFDIGWNVENNG